jgi:hypothetical protein
MYVAKETAQLIEARDGILRLMQEVPLTDEEKSVAEGDVEALNRYIEKRTRVPSPAAPSKLYIFNSSIRPQTRSDDGDFDPSTSPSPMKAGQSGCCQFQVMSDRTPFYRSYYATFISDTMKPIAHTRTMRNRAVSLFVGFSLDVPVACGRRNRIEQPPRFNFHGAIYLR